MEFAQQERTRRIRENMRKLLQNLEFNDGFVNGFELHVILQVIFLGRQGGTFEPRPTLLDPAAKALQSSLYLTKRRSKSGLLLQFCLITNKRVRLFQQIFETKRTIVHGSEIMFGCITFLQDKLKSHGIAEINRLSYIVCWYKRLIFWEFVNQIDHD
jgi:hypothetical protein